MTTGSAPLRRLRRLALGSAFVALAFTSCTPPSRPGMPSPSSLSSVGPATLLGGAGAGAVGGLLGASLSHGNGALTAAGALLGILAGGAVGHVLDTKARPDPATALHQAQAGPPGTTVPWTDPQTKQQGTITSGVWRQRPTGPCRTYTITAVINGQFADLHGCAVQRADGTWEMLPGQ
jgi:surface antigen